MTKPTPLEWGFEEIAKIDPERARRLEQADSSPLLISAVAAALEQAWRADAVRIGIDSRHNKFAECRVIIQFQVCVDIYDWFFNARTGYRAQYWAGPHEGNIFNEELIASLYRIAEQHLLQNINAQKIVVETDNCSRTDYRIGESSIDRTFVLKSLKAECSKVWLCERLIQLDNHPLEIALSVFRHGPSVPKLRIPRWENKKNPKSGEIGEGLRAPYPNQEYAWLDMKGGFVLADGSVCQEKTQSKRTQDIYMRGWT